MGVELEDVAAQDNAAPEELDMLLTELETELESSDLDTPLELDVLADDVVDDASESVSNKLSGLGAVAAASLGAAASAGAVAADKLIKGRNNPTPEPMISELVDADEVGNAGDDALDLLLDDVDFSDEPEFDGEPELAELLKIPDAEPRISTGDDDIDALLGDIMFDKVSEPDEPLDDAESVLDTASNPLAGEDAPGELSDELMSELLGDDIVDDVELPAAPQSSDLDLVKSLMADLTDDPYDAAEDEAASVAPDENELLDDILALSMDDEVALQAEDSVMEDAAPLDEQSAGGTHVSSSEAFVIDIHDDLSQNTAPSAEAPRTALSDIAEAAKADAQRMERGSRFAATGFAAGAGIMIGAASVEDDSSTEDDTSTQDDIEPDMQEAEDILAAIEPVQSEPSNDVEPALEMQTDDLDAAEAATETLTEITPPQETADMPKAAAKKETIIDEVTEEAAAGAFASLNQVVEEKAIMADRGDRIGDLVQEALRPMLKEWLDKNLKGIVERAVTKEVKRISTGK